nr:hypothetical protein [Bordetella parapertussis]
MRIARIAAVAGVVGLAGCSVGTAPGAGAVSGNYKLQTNYQDAYRYATVQAERCLVARAATGWWANSTTTRAPAWCG